MLEEVEEFAERFKQNLLRRQERYMSLPTVNEKDVDVANRKMSMTRRVREMCMGEMSYETRPAIAA